jgi:hypothetical protein
MTDEETRGIAVCMRLNAKLTARIERMRGVLERIAGPSRCGGAMVNDEDGKPFPLDIAKWMVAAHARECHRCLARKALIECSDCGQGFGEQHKPSCHRQGLVTKDSDYRCRHERLNEDGICRACGADCRGIHG